MYPYLTASGTFDRAAIFRDAWKMHRDAKGSFYERHHTLAHCLRAHWAIARRSRARFLNRDKHAALWGALTAAFHPAPVDPVAEMFGERKPAAA